jgi:hypothetical protein
MNHFSNFMNQKLIHEQIIEWHEHFFKNEYFLGNKYILKPWTTFKIWTFLKKPKTKQKKGK